MLEFLKEAAEGLGRLGIELLELIALGIDKANEFADMVPGGEYTRAVFDAIGTTGQAIIAITIWIGCFYWTFMRSK